MELDHEAPIPICDAIEFLRLHGMNSEGIFRAPGNQARVKELIELYNSNYKSREKKTDPHFSVLNEHPETVKPNDISSLIKKFFNSLDEPVVPSKYRGSMTYVVKSNMSVKQKQLELFNILESMPSKNKRLIGFVLNFLRDMLEHEKETKMDARNLGMCMAVCFFRGTNSAEQIMVSQIGTIIIQLYIQSDLPFPTPGVDFVDRNTIYDEHFLPKVTVKERKGSMFGSFRNSMQSLIGGGNGNQMRIALEKLEEEEENNKKSNENTKSTMVEMDKEVDDKNLPEKGIKKTSKKEKKKNVKKEVKEKPKSKPKQRGRANSYLPGSSDFLIEICGVVSNPTVEDLREKNKKSPALLPSVRMLRPSPKRQKPKKNKEKKTKNGRKFSQFSSIGAGSSAITSKVLSVVSNVEEKVEPIDLKKPTEQVINGDKGTWVHKTL